MGWQPCREDVLSLSLPVLGTASHDWCSHRAPFSVIPRGWDSARTIPTVAYPGCPSHGNSVGEDIPGTILTHPDLSLGGSRGLCKIIGPVISRDRLDACSLSSRAEAGSAGCHPSTPPPALPEPRARSELLCSLRTSQKTAKPLSQRTPPPPTDRHCTTQPRTGMNVHAALVDVWHVQLLCPPALPCAGQGTPKGHLQRQ